MQTNWAACVAFTLHEEGGFQNDPHDPGNWTGGKIGAGQLVGTNYGISAASYPWLDIRSLTPERAAAIYEHDYWLHLSGDILSIGADLMTFDFGVNAGWMRSAKFLQAIVRVDQDGAVGPLTLAATRALPPDMLVSSLSAAQEAYYLSLANFPRYGAGWLARLVRRQKLAAALVGKSEVGSALLACL